jgi:hypothetical protein
MVVVWRRFCKVTGYHLLRAPASFTQSRFKDMYYLVRGCVVVVVVAAAAAAEQIGGRE